MREMAKPLQNVLQGKEIKNTPIWLMRQAGRYLPEYKKLRTEAKSFVDFCLTPKLAAQATLQPVERFDVDGAILFADILLVPYGFGQKLSFKEKEGPVLEPVKNENDLDRLIWKKENISSVFETIRLVKEKLPPEKNLIGFAGGPWTVACYMIEGHGKTGFEKACSAIKETPVFVERLLEKIEEATLEYLFNQIRAGAEIIQLFESHAGLLEKEIFQKFIVDPTGRIVQEIKKSYPSIPVIGFPRGALNDDKEIYFQQTGINALGLDQHVLLEDAKRFKKYGVLQGNLDPVLLREGGENMRRKAAEICEALGPRHIFNLGHGVLPDTPPEHVADLVSFVHAGKEKK